MNRVVDSDERRLFEMAEGPNIYYDLNFSVRYKFINNFFAYGGVFLTYHDNTYNNMISVNPVTKDLAFRFKKVAREDINGGLNLGLSYELNPKSKIILEPFAQTNISVTNREKYKLNSYIGNTETEHKYGRIYFSLGMKFKLNRNQEEK